MAFLCRKTSILSRNRLNTFGRERQKWFSPSENNWPGSIKEPLSGPGVGNHPRYCVFRISFAPHLWERDSRRFERERETDSCENRDWTIRWSHFLGPSLFLTLSLSLSFPVTNSLSLSLALSISVFHHNICLDFCLCFRLRLSNLSFPSRLSNSQFNVCSFSLDSVFLCQVLFNFWARSSNKNECACM